MTKADEGAAPIPRRATQVATSGSSCGSIGLAELTHELVRGQLSEYLDDTLGQSDRRRVDGHLAGCGPCSVYLDTLRATVRALGQLPATKAPAGAHARIVEEARREHARIVEDG